MPDRSEEWTLGTLKEHFDERFASAERAVTAALAGSEKAILKAEASADKRAEAANEIRAAMLDQQKTFATREALSAIDKRTDDLADLLKTLTGKSEAFNRMATVVIALAAVGVSAFAIFFKR